MLLLHATCVAINSKAVLITGPAGAGKSDLALRLIDQGAQLVADDQTLLQIEGDALIASPPPTITGLMEVRHAGLMKLPFIPKAPIALYVELTVSDEKLERLPDSKRIFLLDHPVARLRLHAFESSTPAKIRAALIYPIVTDD